MKRGGRSTGAEAAQPTRGRRLTDRATLCLVVGSAIAAPLPFGSQDPFWMALWCLPLATALAAADPGRLAPQARVALFFTIAAVLGVVAIAALQTYALCCVHPIWAEASALLGEDLGVRASASARFPAAALVPGVAAALAFAGGLALGPIKANARQAMAFVVGVAAVYAVLAIALHIWDPDVVLWRHKTHHGGVLTGTFLNRNVCAAFLGLGFVAAVALVADQIGRRRARLRGGAQALLSAILQHPPRRSAAAVAAGGVILAAMLLTASRAGVVVALAAAGGVTVLLWPRSVAGRRSRAAGGAAALLVLVFGAAFGQGIAQRFTESQSTDTQRFEAYEAAFAIALEHPALGTGLGSFRDAFPAYRSDAMSPLGVWDRAHNTYLQLLAEIGFPGLALALTPLFFVGWRLARTALRGGPNRFAASTGLCLLAAPAVHSLFDYPAQIPGYAIPAAALIGYLFSRSGLAH